MMNLHDLEVMEKSILRYNDHDLGKIFKTFQENHPIDILKPYFSWHELISFWKEHSLSLQKRVLLERSCLQTKKKTEEHHLTQDTYEKWSLFLLNQFHSRISPSFIRLFLADICTFLEWIHDIDFLNLEEPSQKRVLKEIKTMFLALSWE